jgi:hypothetical protein
LALMIGQLARVVFLRPLLIFGLGAAAWIAAVLVIVAGARRFRSGEVLARM